MAAQVFTSLSSLRFPYPGEAGSRNMGLAKVWKLTERFDLKFAWEVFNVTNSVRFDDNTLTSLDKGSADGAALGVFRRTLTAPRVSSSRCDALSEKKDADHSECRWSIDPENGRFLVCRIKPGALD